MKRTCPGYGARVERKTRRHWPKYRDEDEGLRLRSETDLGSRTFATAREIKSTELLRGMYKVVPSKPYLT